MQEEITRTWGWDQKKEAQSKIRALIASDRINNSTSIFDDIMPERGRSFEAIGLHYSLPVWLVDLVDAVFEEMPEQHRGEFISQVLAAIPCLDLLGVSYRTFLASLVSDPNKGLVKLMPDVKSMKKATDLAGYIHNSTSFVRDKYDFTVADLKCRKRFTSNGKAVHTLLLSLDALTKIADCVEWPDYRWRRPKNSRVSEAVDAFAEAHLTEYKNTELRTEAQMVRKRQSIYRLVGNQLIKALEQNK